jgi:hypothetical protein
VGTPSGNLTPYRLDLGKRFAGQGIVDVQPAKLGETFVTAVPLVDRDGLDLGGIRLPEIAVPLATHTGWNLRRPETGAPTKLARWSGSMLPFPSTDAIRSATKDPRRSIEQRYPSKEDYARKIKAAADDLVDRRFLLARDRDDITEAALERFEKVQSHVPSDTACAFTQLDASTSERQSLPKRGPVTDRSR